MSGSLKRQWKEMTAGRPGTRFQKRYEQHRRQRSGAWRKPVYLAFGTLLLIVGLLMLPAPGPGFLVLFVGAGLLAEESLWVARLLDSAEVRARKLAAAGRRGWSHASTPLKALIGGSGAALLALTVWTAYRVLAE